MVTGVHYDEAEPVYLSLDDVPLDDYDGSADGDNRDVLHKIEFPELAQRLLKAEPDPPLHGDRRTLPRGAKVVPYRGQVKLGSKGKRPIAYKRALARHPHSGYGWRSNWTPLFGIFAVRAVKRVQKRHGIEQTGVVGPKTHAVLARYFDAYALRYLWSSGTATDSKQRARDRIVACAYLGYRERASINYTQSYPWRVIGLLQRIRPPHVPPWADCSSFLTWCWFAGDAPLNPNGYQGWPAYGFTGTLRQHGRVVFSPRPADDAHYGGGTGAHVAVVVTSSGRIVSHGSSYGPVLTVAHYRGDFSHYRDHLGG